MEASGASAPEPEKAAVAPKAAAGVLLLLARTGIVQGIAFLGLTLLMRMLEPADFGLFAVLQFLMLFLGQLGDAGIGAALIRQEEKPSKHLLDSVFTFQVGVALALLVILWLGAPIFLMPFRDMPPASAMLLRATALNLVLTVARTIPAILLERALDYARLGVIDVVLSLVFWLVAVAGASMGFGTYAWGGALLAQGIAGTIAAYSLVSYRPGLVWDWAAVRPILGFGVQFQTKHLVGMVNAALAPVVGGATLGARGVGLLSWAQQTAHAPLLVVDALSRVSLPVYARLQSDPEALRAQIRTNMRLASLAVFFFLALFGALAHPIVTQVFTDRWSPAIPYLYVYSSMLVYGAFVPVAAPAFDAVGMPHLLARLSILWTTINWIVVPITASRFGAMGFVLGLCVHVVVGNGAVVYAAWERFRIFLPRYTGLALVCALPTYFVGARVLAPFATSLPRLGAAVVAMLAVFLASVSILDPSIPRSVLAMLRKKKPA